MDVQRELSRERACYLTRRWFLPDWGVGLADAAISSLLASCWFAERHPSGPPFERLLQ